MKWLKKWFSQWRTKYRVIEKVSFIREEGDPDPDPDPTKLSLIDIKAAIAAQSIPVDELYTRQDLAANRNVIELIHNAENKARGGLEKEIIILKKSKGELQAFKDKADVSTLVEKCKVLVDKDPATVEYIRARMGSGRGVHFDNGLTEQERQDKVNEAIIEELELIDKQGITFKKVTKDGKAPEDDFTDDPNNLNDTDMSNPDHNTLIPSKEESKKS